MKLAYMMAPGRGDTDLMLHQLSQRLIRQGYRPAGTVQINTECADAGPCDMDVQVLPDGPTIRISQSLGPAAKGCRLDPQALESAVALVEGGLANGADCLIVNKFGKHEAEGRGFRTVIAKALELDIPVLVGLSGLNRTAFLDFSEGFATELPPDPAALADWITSSVVVRSPALSAG